MIEFETVEVRAGGRLLAQVEKFSAQPGETALLLGPSGSGKTTLLNMAGGLTPVRSGRIRVNGQDLAALGPAALDRFRGATIGIVFQTLRLIRALSVRENLALAMRLAGQRPDRARIEETLDRLGIAALANARPRRLSVGETQRAAIARAIVARPKAILADEPTSALDDANAAAALDLLEREARACGAALLIATHDSRVKDRGGPCLILAQPAEARP